MIGEQKVRRVNVRIIGMDNEYLLYQNGQPEQGKSELIRKIFPEGVFAIPIAMDLLSTNGELIDIDIKNNRPRLYHKGDEGYTERQRLLEVEGLWPR